jgi:hypothetical protein
METITKKWTNETGEVISSWLTEDASLCRITVLVNGEEQEWRLDEIDGGMDAYWEYGLDVVDALTGRL